MMIVVENPKFKLGQVVATPACLSVLEEAGQSPWKYVSRHVAGDFGEELCDEDRQLNEQAVEEGSRILSAYMTGNGVKIWVITEAEDDNGQRAATTLLLPDEY